MSQIVIPDNAQKIIETLTTNGHEAYIVGGCVRDALLGRVAYDYDITTSAFPEEIKELFERTVDTGISHGTVTVISDGIPYEVTTFRIDGEYHDSRHPVSVSFTKNVEYDLARRDFTVNAMCYNHESGIIDVFGGIEDLEKRIIRAVGDPELRFSEDALRVFRAIRFAATLGFKIEENTKKAIHKYKEKLKSISAERINTEWQKLLSGEYAYEVIEEYKDVISAYISELKDLNMPDRVKFNKLTPKERQIALFAKSGGAKSMASGLERLKSDNKTKEFSLSVIENLTLCDSMSDAELKMYLQGISDEGALSAALICYALGLCSEDIYSKLSLLIESNTPRRISDLAIGGRQLLEAGYVGEEIGRMLNRLLVMVAKGEIENDKQALSDFVRNSKVI